MHNNYQPNQKLKIITIQLAIPADIPEGQVCDGISEMVNAAIVCNDSVIADWGYTVSPDEALEVQIGDHPEEGEAFCLLPKDTCAIHATHDPYCPSCIAQAMVTRYLGE